MKSQNLKYIAYISMINEHIFGNILLEIQNFPNSRSRDICIFSGGGGRGFGKSSKFQSGQKWSSCKFLESSKRLVFKNCLIFEDLTIFDKVIS
jgi:hypothetical protein